MTAAPTLTSFAAPRGGASVASCGRAPLTLLVLHETVTVAAARHVLQLLAQTIRRGSADALSIDYSAR